MIKNAKLFAKIVFEKWKSAILKFFKIHHANQTFVLAKLRKKQYKKRLAALRAKLRAKRKKALPPLKRPSLFFKYTPQTKTRALSALPKQTEPLARKFANRK